MTTKNKIKDGRPTIFTQEIADKLCAALADGDSMRTVCKPDDMPCKTTVFMWLRTKEDFLNQYTRAKQESADALTDEMLDIADDGTNDYMTGKDGQEVLNTDHIQRSKLRIETRKWCTMASATPRRPNWIPISTAASCTAAAKTFHRKPTRVRPVATTNAPTGLPIAYTMPRGQRIAKSDATSPHPSP